MVVEHSINRRCTQIYADEGTRSSSPAVRDTHTRATCCSSGARAELNRIPILFRDITLSALIRVHRYPSVVKNCSFFHRPGAASQLRPLNLI